MNTDADNQYQAGDITKLIGPIVSGHADIVVGARPIADIEHFSAVKKSLQRLGSGTIKWLTGADVTDATSGFRAISRDAALGSMYLRLLPTPLRRLSRARAAA